MTQTQTNSTAAHSPANSASPRPARDQIPARFYYDGLPVWADSLNVHEQAMSLVEKFAKKDALFCDIGAGAGAFSKRLINQGFPRVECIELQQTTVQLPAVPIHARDLNTPWSVGLENRFDSAAALNVLEYLENPWHFARQCAAILKPGGVLIVALPNIESSRSRLEFLLKAQFRFFGREGYRVGHLTPITQEYLLRTMDRAGFTFTERRYSTHRGIMSPTSPQKILRGILYAISYPFMAGWRVGEVSIVSFARR
jgi:2-polyprenyl-3-methyl-5-hydroxy-6-metoxy-1,4-benzoquinol methylase